MVAKWSRLFLLVAESGGGRLLTKGGSSGVRRWPPAASINQRVMERPTRGSSVRSLLSQAGGCPAADREAAVRHESQEGPEASAASGRPAAGQMLAAGCAYGQWFPPVAR